MQIRVYTLAVVEQLLYLSMSMKLHIMLQNCNSSCCVLLHKDTRVIYHMEVAHPSLYPVPEIWERPDQGSPLLQRSGRGEQRQAGWLPPGEHAAASSAAADGVGDPSVLRMVGTDCGLYPTRLKGGMHPT